MGEEIELKLALQPEHVERLRRHPVLRELKLGRGSTTRLVSTYFDTPAFALLRNKVALRVRRIGEERIQTIKRDREGANGTGVRRGEWEQAIQGDWPDLSQLEDPELKRLIGAHSAKGELRPVFTTEVVRRTWPLRIGRSQIECALDVGEIKADGQSQSLCEVELELKAGQPQRLFELARRLNRTVPLRLEPASKAARGYSLAAGAPPSSRRAEPVRLSRRMTVGEGFAAVARACVDHIIANVDSAHHGENSEGVHQLRVGIRRLRAALGVFRDALPAGERAALAADLRWLQRELGPAREWDVLIEETIHPAMRRLKGGEGLARLLGLALARREEAYARARAALEEPRSTDLLLRMEGWIDEQGSGARRANGKASNGHRREGERKRAEPAEAVRATARSTESETPFQVRGRPLPAFAFETLRARYAKADKLGGNLRKLDQEELHELRIRIKKLRYATEFFRDLYPEKPVKRFVARLKELQEALGEAQDAVVAAGLIAKLEEAAGPGSEHAVGLLQGWTAAGLKRDRKRLLTLWRHFAALKIFWKRALPRRKPGAARAARLS